MKTTRSNRLKRGTLLLAIFVGLIALPMIAWAVPGSGDFISNHAPSGRAITDLYNIIAKICLGILILVEGVLLYAIIRFRRKSDDERPKQVHGDLRLEIGWTVAAAVLQVFIGAKTIDVMFEVEEMPQTSMTVEAIAYQWGWQFRYPDHGGMLTDDLVVPAHKNIKLEITSRDVIHSIFIPELGVKMDAVPGRFNYWWFNADGPINQVLADQRETVSQDEVRKATTRPDIFSFFSNYGDRPVTGLEQRVTYLAASREVGDVSPYAKYDAVEYRGMCTEICGKGHYNMYFRTVAMTESSFEQWVVDQQTNAGEVDGASVYAAKCASCHASDGKGSPPSFPPLVGTKWMEPDQKEAHIEVVLLGSKASTMMGDTEVLGVTYTGVMQPWAEALNDAEVAAVVNHERLSWGNDGGEVTDEDVAKLRESLGLPPFPAGGGAPIPQDVLVKEGEQLYASCVSCHGNDGKGLDQVPNLTGSPLILSDVKGTLDVLLNGQNKPEWPGEKTRVGRPMSDRQLAALLTYMRSSWGNEGSPVMPEEVSRLRNEVVK